jgi:hypothetical protein
MTRFLSALATLTFVLGIGGTALATSKTKATPMPNSMMMAKPMKCAKGKKYVKPYTKKDGTMVKGYCR